MSRFPLSRRQVLKSLGVAAGLVPMLEATRARAATPIKRLLIMSKGGGNIAGEFWPKGSGEDLRTLTLGSVTKQLDSYKPYLNFVGGLAISAYKGPGDGHLNYGSILTGAGVNREDNNPATTASVDWVIGQELMARHKLAYPTLSVSVMDLATQGLGQISWRGNRQANTSEFDPYRLFDRVFGGRQLSEDPALARLRRENRSLLDFAGKRIEAFGKDLGAEDRNKIDAHLSSVRSIEQQLSKEGETVCAAPAPQGQKLAVREGGNTPALLRLQIDLVMAAMRCDLTRVATINIADTFGDGLRFGWLGLNRTYHGIKHKNGMNFDSWVDEELKVEPWFMSNFLYLLQEMEKTKEAGESMLDTSIALWCDTLSSGTNHQFRGMPWILAGKAGGYFRTGRLVRLGGWRNAPGEYWRAGDHVPHNALLVSLCNAMDVPRTSFGDAALGSGEVAELKAG